MWADLAAGRAAPRHRRLPPVRLDPRGRRPARVVRRRGRRARAGRRRRPGTATCGRGGATRTRPRRRAGRRHRLAPRLRAGRRRVRRPARRGLAPSPRRRAARARVHARPGRSASPVRRRGGRPVRRRLRRVPADHRRARRRPGARADRRRRRQLAEACARPAATRAARAATRDAGRIGDVRRAARRAGPRAGRRSTAPSASAAASGRTAAGGSTSPARPTTPAPPRWTTGRTRCSRFAARVLAARRAAPAHGALRHRAARSWSTPNAANAIPSRVTAWLDARGRRRRHAVRRLVVEEVAARGARCAGGTVDRGVAGRDRDGRFDAGWRSGSPRCSARRTAPVLPTGAGHDAGVLAAAGVPTAMLFVRNPTGVSHSPAEHAERDDCLAGVEALTAVLAELASARPSTVTTSGRSARRARPARRGRAGRRRRSSTTGRFTAITPRHRGRGDAIRLPGVVLPGFADAHSHAFHRALRGRTHDEGGTFWTWRERMYALAGRLDPDSLPRPGPRRLRRDGARRRHRGRRVPLPAPRPGRPPVRRPERDGRRRWSHAAADAGIRLTLLDTCYLAGGSVDGPPGRGRAAPVRDGDVEAWAARRRRAARRPGRCGSAWPRSLGPGGAAGRLPTVVARGAAGPAAARAPLRAARRERRCLRRARPHPDELLAGRGCSARARPRCTPPTSPTPTSPCSAAAGTAVVLCPTTERDLADGIGPAGRCATPAARWRSAPTSTPSSTRSRRHARLEMHERLATGQRGRFTPAELLDALTAPGTQRSAGPTPGGSRVGRPRRPRRGPPRHRPDGGRRPGAGRVRRDRRRRRHVVVDGRRRGQRRPARARRRRRAAAGGHRAAVGGRGDRASTRCGTASVVTRRSDAASSTAPATRRTRLAARCATRAVVVEDGDRRWVGPAAARPAGRPADRPRRPRGAPRVRRLAHATWCSPATARPSSPPGWPASRYDRRRDRARRSPPPAPPTDDELRALLAARIAELRAAGHHDRRDQERLRPHRRRRGPRAAPGRRGDRRRRPSSARTSSRRSTPADPAGYLALVMRPDAGRLRAARPLDRRVLRAGGPHAFDGDEARAVLAAGRAAGLGLRVHGNQLGPGPGCGSPSSWARRASTTAPT